MARGTKTSKQRIAIWVAVLAIAIVAAGFGLRRVLSSRLPPIVMAVSTLNHAGTASAGRKVTVAGKLEISKPPRDAQLGIAADAAILFRHVEMYEWLEHCEGDVCRYHTGWSAPVDSSKFKSAHGHEPNPTAPFGDAKFVAGEIRLGTLIVDPDLIADQSEAMDYPVRTAALQPNMAATFREIGGALYAGGDPAKPRVGQLRVSYRIAPGVVSLTGVQRGAKLTMN